MQSRKTTTIESETQSTRAPFGQSPGNGQPYGRRQPSKEEIAKRAYEIYKSGKGGSDVENWYRAERELRAA
jgi:hypothetical protein